MQRVSEDHEYIISRASELSDDEAAFFRRLFERVLVTGRRNYSPWQAAAETRDMRLEAQEELLDGCVYLAMDSVIRARRKSDRLHRFLHADDTACTDCFEIGRHRADCPWVLVVPAPEVTRG